MWTLVPPPRRSPVVPASSTSSLGSTPAAMAADWLTSLLDQNAFSRISSEFASAVEDVALQWLCGLVGLLVRGVGHS